VENLEENVTLLGLSSCHSILKSQCGKQKCQSEPEIILPAEGKKNPAKEKLYVFSTEEDSFSESETSNEEDSENNGNEIEVDPCDNSVERSWGSLCLPHLSGMLLFGWGKEQRVCSLEKFCVDFWLTKMELLKN